MFRQSYLNKVKGSGTVFFFRSVFVVIMVLLIVSKELDQHLRRQHNYARELHRYVWWHSLWYRHSLMSYCNKTYRFYGGFYLTPAVYSLGLDFSTMLGQVLKLTAVINYSSKKISPLAKLTLTNSPLSLSVFLYYCFLSDT